RMGGQTAEFIAAKRCVNYLLRDFDNETRELNAIRLKELKNLVKNHSNIIADLMDYLLKFVRQGNNDRRLAILLICDHFFQRSHLFRIELTNSLQDFLVYTAETDPLHHPLPSPKETSNTLKMEALKLMKIWHEKFSSAYPKLDRAYNFLRSSKAFDFERADAQLQNRLLVYCGLIAAIFISSPNSFPNLSKFW
uniref:VHS domain-containing protein n=1 Tax=Parascaris univalens TaxID=6257 RepID=A0A915C341_PARUN